MWRIFEKVLLTYERWYGSIYANHLYQMELSTMRIHGLRKGLYTIGMVRSGSLVGSFGVLW